MKTNHIASPPAPARAASPLALVKSLGKVLLTAFCASLVSFAAMPAANAAAPDGEYQFVKGSISVIEVPQDLVEQLADLQDGKLVIKDSKFLIKRKAAAKIIQDLGDQLGIAFDIDISGPTSVKLNKSGKTYVGSTSKPMVIAFATDYEGQELKGRLETHFKLKVKGKILTMTIPFKLKALGRTLSGEIDVVCKRV